jgi:hypothetical protein
MVRRRRKVIWTVEALSTKKSLYKYWNLRNKSTLFSKKLELLFKEKTNQIAHFPESSLEISANLRIVLVRDYYLIFEFDDKIIKVLDIWDTRQNPENFPVK